MYTLTWNIIISHQDIVFYFLPKNIRYTNFLLLRYAKNIEKNVSNIAIYFSALMIEIGIVFILITVLTRKLNKRERAENNTK